MNKSRPDNMVPTRGAKVDECSKYVSDNQFWKSENEIWRNANQVSNSKLCSECDLI